MALPTFGVTVTTMTYRFAGDSFSTGTWSDAIDRWIGQAAAWLDSTVRQQGYSDGAAGVEARGADDAFYVLCARYIEADVTVQIARSATRFDPDYAKAAAEHRDELAKHIQTHAESLIPDVENEWNDPDKARPGTFKAGRASGRWSRTGGRRQSSLARGLASDRARKGRGSGCC